jgi:hypothetical protein
MKTLLSGGSSGLLLLQVLTIISSVPNLIVWPIEASKVITVAVTLSKPLITAVLKFSAHRLGEKNKNRGNTIIFFINNYLSKYHTFSSNRW